MPKGNFTSCAIRLQEIADETKGKLRHSYDGETHMHTLGYFRGKQSIIVSSRSFSNATKRLLHKISDSGMYESWGIHARVASRHFEDIGSDLNYINSI